MGSMQRTAGSHPHLRSCCRLPKLHVSTSQPRPTARQLLLGSTASAPGPAPCPPAAAAPSRRGAGALSAAAIAARTSGTLQMHRLRGVAAIRSSWRVAVWLLEVPAACREGPGLVTCCPRVQVGRCKGACCSCKLYACCLHVRYLQKFVAACCSIRCSSLLQYQVVVVMHYVLSSVRKQGAGQVLLSAHRSAQ
jgi:hypothetical protein